MRDRLIELLKQVDEYGDALSEYSEKADYRIGRGVILPPCKVGDTVWYIDRPEMRVVEAVVKGVCYNAHNFFYDIVSEQGYRYAHEDGVYASREEAERALAERSGG